MINSIILAFVCLMFSAGNVHAEDIGWGGLAESLNFIMVGMLMVSIIGAVISALSGLITKKYKAVRFFGLLIMVSILAMMVNMQFLDRERDAAEKAAYQVIAAIERYQSAHGALPTTLDRLVPEQLPHVPTASKGRKFIYDPGSNDFSLSFAMPVMLERKYDSKSKKWSTSD